MMKVKNRAKSFLSAIIAVVMLLSVLQLNSFAATSKSGDYEYTLLSDNTAKITDYIGNAKTITIPSTLDGHSVTVIGERAFQFSDSLTSITIPDSVKSIENYAFFSCEKLTKITISSSVTKLGDNIFDWSFKLSEINVDENNPHFSSTDGIMFNKDKTTIVKYPLGKADSTYTIPATVKTVGKSAFEESRNLLSIKIPSSVESIEANAFYDCDKIKEMIIPGTVKAIGESAFGDCDLLKKVTIKNGVKTLGNGLFMICWSLEDVSIPTSVTKISKEMFSECHALKELTIPDSVTSIGDFAFYGCNFKSFKIPKGITAIGKNVFYECEALKTIKVSSDSKSFSAVDGVLYNKNKTKIIAYPMAKEDKIYTIPSSVRVIGDYAFYNCKKLKEIKMSSGVTAIGERAFVNCSSLKTFPLSSNITKIGSYAFLGCYKLKQIAVPSKVKTIAENTFAGCSGLKSITIPSSVKTVENSAFEDCISLSDVHYLGTQKQWNKIKFGESTGRAKKATRHYCTTSKTKKVKNKKTATYFVKGYTGDTYCKKCGKLIIEGVSVAKKVLKTPTVTIKPSGNTIRVKYNKVKNATGFEVVYTKGSKTYKKVYTTRKSVTKKINIKNAAAYKVKVRAFIKSGTKTAYSKWQG